MHITTNPAPVSDQDYETAVIGMDCAQCAQTLEHGIRSLPGVTGCVVNWSTTHLHVRYDPQQLDEDSIVTRIRLLGYDIATPSLSAPAAQDLSFLSFMRSRPAMAQPLIMGIVLLLLALALRIMTDYSSLPYILEVLALIIAGYPIARAGLSALLVSRQITINLLMIIAAVGAVVIGETTEAIILMLLFVIGELLEGFTSQRSSLALQQLMCLAPAEATLLLPCHDSPACPPREQTVPVCHVQPGQTILVKPGERIPLDGTILRGRSSINQQHITGESLPIERTVGELVYAGSINGQGALEITVTAPANETLLSRIATLVEQARAQRAPIERFINRFAAVYTPAVVVVAILVALIPPVFFGQPFWNSADVEHGWFYRALTLLVIACPCALVISTPVSIVSALSAATRMGILIKGGAILESLHHVRIFAFDKTGTITVGQPTVASIRCIDSDAHLVPGIPTSLTCHCTDLLALAAAIERRSAHPLAHAVVQAAHDHHLSLQAFVVEDVEALPGRGIQGIVNGQQVTIGSQALFASHHATHPDLWHHAHLAEANGETLLFVESNERLLGYLSVADMPRPSSRQALEDLRAAGITHTVLLTGDTLPTATRIGHAVGIDEIRASLLPADKLDALHDLRHRHGAIAMVGDGINDTPALAAADIGIAMGVSGSAQALDTADIALMHDDLTSLPKLLHLSRRTHTIIRQNIALSLLPKALILLLALGGWATLWMAILADMGTSLLVTANGMRLSRPS